MFCYKQNNWFKWVLYLHLDKTLEFFLIYTVNLNLNRSIRFFIRKILILELCFFFVNFNPHKQIIKPKIKTPNLT